MMDGFQVGDHSVTKALVIKDQRHKKEWNKRISKGPVTASSSPMRRIKNSCNSHNSGTHRYVSIQRPSTMQEMDDIEYVEKDFLAEDRKKSGQLSLSHLLNFSVASRERNPGILASGSHNYVRNKKIKQQSMFTKEQFLQANCQFVVREGYDYSVHTTQSDQLVDWTSIEQIRLFCYEIPSCPVCLFIPTAAKVTRCGHVFCYSCILHYLTLSDKKWRKCPICFESIYKHDLKSVTTVASKRYKVNDMISMTLMKRKKGTTIVRPYSDWDDSCTCLEMQSFDNDRYYSKLVVASASQILPNVIEPEKKALQKQLSTLTHDEESERCFISMALEDIQLRIDSIVQPEKRSSEDVYTCSLEQLDDPTSFDPDHKYTDNGCTGSDTNGASTCTCTFPSVSRRSEYVYFYQATDGQHLYIHPLNGKALVAEYGIWEECPTTITGRIVEIEQCTMTEDERIQIKLLNHLPLTCEFAFCELDLGPPFISFQTLEKFRDPLQKRKQRRQKKKREERRLEKKQSKQSSIVFSSNTADITPEDFHDFLSVASSPPLPPSIIPTHPVETPKGGSTCTTCTTKAPSFAQALVQGDKKLPLNCTCLSCVNNGSDIVTSQQTCYHYDDTDFQNQPIPSFQNSFSNALLTSTHDVLISTENQRGKPSGSKAAKKGRKKIVLFSTADGNRKVY